jgi:hypothetical protein
MPTIVKSPEPECPSIRRCQEQSLTAFHRERDSSETPGNTLVKTHPKRTCRPASLQPQRDNNFGGAASAEVRNCLCERAMASNTRREFRSP